MARFQNYVMLFKMAARFPNIWALGNILVSVLWLVQSLSPTPYIIHWSRWQLNKIQKDPVLARPDFTVYAIKSPTPYIIHWSRWQLFCVETGPKLKQTAIFC